MPVTKPIISLADLKTQMPIRDNNVEFDERFLELIDVATAQIEGATKRFFTSQAHVELFNSRKAFNRVLNLTGIDTFNTDTFVNQGTVTELIEQTLVLRGFPLDASKAITLRYDVTRKFTDANTLLAATSFEADPDNSRIFMRAVMRRGLQRIQATYTAGFAVPTVAVTPTTYDPLNKDASVTLSAADLTAAHSSGGTGSAFTRARRKGGKYIAEFTCDVSSVSPATASVGFALEGAGVGTAIGNGATSFGYFGDGKVKTNGVEVVPAITADTWTAGDVITLYLDLDNGNVWFAKNGALQNGATLAEIEANDKTNAFFTGLTGTFMLGTGDPDAAQNYTFTGNFGAAAFTATTPDKFSGGFGEDDETNQNLSASAPADLKLACSVQAAFLFKKLDPENVGARQDKKQGGIGIDFLKAAGLTPEVGSLLTKFVKLTHGSG